jgi:hypothetical protein
MKVDERKTVQLAGIPSAALKPAGIGAGLQPC